MPIDAAEAAHARARAVPGRRHDDHRPRSLKRSARSSRRRRSSAYRSATSMLTFYINRELVIEVL